VILLCSGLGSDDVFLPPQRYHSLHELNHRFGTATSSFDHLVGALPDQGRDGDAERLGGLHIDD
jgi:hypothetical protein